LRRVIPLGPLVGFVGTVPPISGDIFAGAIGRLK